MTITAKYPGRCTHCHGAIAVGESVEWAKSQGARHVSCPSVVAPPVRKTRQDNGWCNRCQSHCYGDCTASQY